MADFLPGVDLCRAFYEEVVAPKVRVPHSAGLLGPGSDVLGYDTQRSTDHDWGPRCTVIVPQSAVEETRKRILADLPVSYRGWAVQIGHDGQSLNPHVVIDSLSSWLAGQVGWDVGAAELTVTDWLLIPQQRLLGITQGAVFADHDEQLEGLRRRLAWYPEPVWWWLLACQWRRLAQEEPFVHRTAEVGDDLGSRVVSGRLVRDCMRLALLIGRRYAPYSKWLGTAFARLPDPDGLAARLHSAITATAPVDREAALGRAYVSLGTRFNLLSPEASVDTSLRPFFDRPARVIGADRFAAAALKHVSDRSLAALPLIGSVDQMLDCTDILSSADLTLAMRAYYRAWRHSRMLASSPLADEKSHLLIGLGTAAEAGHRVHHTTATLVNELVEAADDKHLSKNHRPLRPGRHALPRRAGPPRTRPSRRRAALPGVHQTRTKAVDQHRFQRRVQLVGPHPHRPTPARRRRRPSHLRRPHHRNRHRLPRGSRPAGNADKGRLRAAIPGQHIDGQGRNTRRRTIRASPAGTLATDGLTTPPTQETDNRARPSPGRHRPPPPYRARPRRCTRQLRHRARPDTAEPGQAHSRHRLTRTGRTRSPARPPVAAAHTRGRRQVSGHPGGALDPPPPTGHALSTGGPPSALGHAPLFPDAHYYGDRAFLRVRPVQGHPGWYGAKTPWASRTGYLGWTLIRTARLDGPGQARLQLQLAEGTKVSDALPVNVQADWQYWGGGTEVTNPGCYGYQIDGSGFTEVIVFRAELAS